MTPLIPNGKIDLEHRAFFLSGSSDGSSICAASSDGHLSSVDLKHCKVRLRRPTKKLQAITSHPFEPLHAFVDGASGSLVVQGNDGETITQLHSNAIEKRPIDSIKEGFTACHFDISGEYLWLVAPRAIDECKLSLIETTGWTVVHEHVVHDDFGDSSWSFHSTGTPDLLSLWIAAGQDGQQVHWLKRTNARFSVNEAEELVNCIPPIFSPDGSEFLVLSQENAICRYAFPSMHQLASPLQTGDEDNPFAESLCYLDSKYAFASTGQGRVFLVETSTMTIDDEVAIEGHEPRPIGEYYPLLARECCLGTDISWFTKLGRVTVFVFRRDGGSGLNGWKDSLAWYSL